MKTEPASKGLEILARLGYAARGAVYCLVGVLAVKAALGAGGTARGSRDALQTLGGNLFGEAILALVAIGLAGFALWRSVQAIFDPDREGAGWKALARRAGFFIGAIVYLGLAGTALKLAFGSGPASNSGDRAAQDWTAWLLAEPLGRWMTGAVGIAIICAGITFVAKAWLGHIGRHLKLTESERGWVGLLGRAGHAASGVVFVLVGTFLLLAAIHYNPGQARGLGGALRALEAERYGPALLALVAAGLFAFGVYGIVQGIYRRIRPPDIDEAKSAIAHDAELASRL